jgi:hypothetical protein
MLADMKRKTHMRTAAQPCSGAKVQQTASMSAHDLTVFITGVRYFDCFFFAGVQQKDYSTVGSFDPIRTRYMILMNSSTPVFFLKKIVSDLRFFSTEHCNWNEFTASFLRAFAEG